METFVSLNHKDAVIIINGIRRFSDQHYGIDAWMSVLGQIPPRYDNFSVTLVNMIVDGDQVFTQLHGIADGMDADFGHSHKLVDGKIKEFWIYDDSQKMAHAMKAVQQYSV